MTIYFSVAYTVAAVAMFLASTSVERYRYLTALVRAILWPVVLLIGIFAWALKT